MDGHVVIDEDRQIAPAFARSLVVGRCGPAGPFRQPDDSRTEPVSQVRCLVGRTIIDDNDCIGPTRRYGQRA